MKPMKKVLVVLTLLVLVGCSANYSRGYRVGVIRKFSEKGLIWKSWEGEMLLNYSKNDQVAVVPDVWEFSLDPSPSHGENIQQIVKQISDALDSGERTRLTYVQDTRPRPSFDTSYVIQKVEILTK